MKQITQKTIQRIEADFKKCKGYILSEENPIYCPQVNGLINIWLAELGLGEVSGTNIKEILASSLYNPTDHLFYRESNLEGQVVNPNYNSCKNAIGALGLFANNFTLQANQTIDSVRKSPLYDHQAGLFMREYNPKTNELNHLVITQSNLWIVIALCKLGKKDETQDIMESLEKAKYDSNKGLFRSQDCRFKDTKTAFYSDDQALAILAYSDLEENIKAQSLMRKSIQELYDSNTGLFNSSVSENSVDRTKSTYKNSLIGLALGKLGLNEELKRLQNGLVSHLYDPESCLFRQSTNNKIKIPDNSALALACINYDTLRHLVF